jgi:drug/metabolite transporter (DMT)-like permease
MNSPAAVAPAAAASRERLGLLLGLAGVLAFSLTLPMTRLAVGELDAGFVAFGRMAFAGIAAGLWLWLARAPRPGRAHLPWLAGGTLAPASAAAVGAALTEGRSV